MSAPNHRVRPTTEQRPRSVETALLTLAIHALLVVSVVAAMHRIDSADRFGVIAPMAVLGLLLGYWLAIARVQDFVAHSIALWTGAVVAIFAAALASSSPGEIIESRGRLLTELTSGVIRSLFEGGEEPADDRELLVALGLLAWLVAYSSAWVLYRRFWFGAAVAAPAVVLLTFIQVDDRSGGIPLTLFLFAAICLAARGHITERTLRWSRQGIPAIAGLAPRFLVASLPIAGVAVLLGSLVSPIAHEWLRIPRRESIEQFMSSTRDNLYERWGSNRTEPGSYSNFPDTFSVGGELDLSDEVVVTVDAAVPHYLAARRYDSYNGLDWNSDVESTFRLPGDSGDVRVISVGYPAFRAVALTADVMDDRQSETATITVVTPKNGLVLSIDTFSSADREVFAILGWRQLNGFEIDVESAVDVPVDLLALVNSVKGAAFQIDESSGEIDLLDPVRQEEFETAVENLGAYPVRVALKTGDAGQLIIVVTGRVPNYDDIEMLFTQPEIELGEEYQVTGLASVASRDELKFASTNYPSWVTDRYLQESDTVTEETRQLARQIATDFQTETSFDTVWAIQEYLRTSYTYQLNGPGPPDGQDIVDYFLFDYKFGRCTHFASSMVVMLRSLGIPARMVGGYSPSSELVEGQYIYRENQAHTWVEVFFPGYGWVPFEPTPSQARFEYGATQPEEQPVDGELPVASPTPEASPPVEPEPSPTDSASPVPPVLNIQPKSDEGGWSSLALLAIGILFAAGLSAMTWFMLSWKIGNRGLSPAGTLLARLQRVGSWFGVKPSPSTTPNEYVKALTRVLPAAENAARSITAAYYVEQFGPEPERARALVLAENGWRLLRRNLLRWRLRRPRA